MDDLRARALRAAREAETPFERQRREAVAAAEASRKAHIQRLVDEANQLCRRELGVKVNPQWRLLYDDQGLCAEIDGVQIKYFGNGRLSHTLASLGKEIARRGRP